MGATDKTQLTRSCRHDSDLMPIPSGTRRGRRIDVGPTTILRHRVEYVKSVSVQLRFDAIGPTGHNRHREEVEKTSGTKNFANIRNAIILVGRSFPNSLSYQAPITIIIGTFRNNYDMKSQTTTCRPQYYSLFRTTIHKIYGPFHKQYHRQPI